VAKAILGGELAVAQRRKALTYVAFFEDRFDYSKNKWTFATRNEKALGHNRSEWFRRGGVTSWQCIRPCGRSIQEEDEGSRAAKAIFVWLYF
jgi:hypothetical protein